MIRTLLCVMTITLSACAHAEQFERPDVIRFGASIAELERDLEGLCSERTLRPIDPPFLPDVRERQMQIDCEGFHFMGAGRHVEFVIRDDRLVMVWLMVEDSETQRMIAAMRDAYGAPTRQNSAYVAFEDERTAWRYRPAEFLFWAEELDADISENFD